MPDALTDLAPVSPPRTPARRSAGLGEALRWTAFRMLERLSDWRGNNTQGVFALSDPQARGPALWLYVTTIGELNAVAPMLEWLVAQRPDLRPVLITEHAHYQEAYLARLPGAVVCLTRGHSLDARKLAAQLPPQVLALAEIPCLPSDAPCRFSYAFLREARRCGASTLLLNGWLYHYAPPARLDQVERQLLEADFLRALDVLCVQDAATAQILAGRGAAEDRLVVTGNMKFDAMQRPHWQVSQARSPGLLGALIEAGRPTVVGGCVTELAEQQAVLGAFQRLRQQHPQALLILAPRHPENRERMQALLAQVEAQDLRWVRRSAVPDAALPEAVNCLVLDTVGELRDFYAAASVAHVGVDHNVLEPLGLGKPLTIQEGWNTTYPSYPVYRLLRDQGVLHSCADEAALHAYWRAAIEGAASVQDDLRRTEEVLSALRGSVARHQQACLPWVAR